MCLAPYKLHRKNTELSSFPHKVQNLFSFPSLLISTSLTVHSITHHTSGSQVLKLKERLILNTYLLNKFEMQLGSFLTFEIE